MDLSNEKPKMLIVNLDIFARNDWWAHIEACASIVTACLPTFVPLITNLGMPGSILSGLRSLLSHWSITLSSSTSSGRRDARHESSESLHTDNTWYKLDTRSEAHAVDAKHRVEEDSLVGHPASIQVQKSFGSEVDRGVL